MKGNTIIMKLKTFVMILGVVMILIQALAFIGMNRMYVGLYPEMEDVWNSNYFYSDSVPVEKKLLFAFTAGFERFMTSFSDLTFDIENEYRNTSPTQYMSTHFRYSLRYNDPVIPMPFNYLGLYDAILTFSYCIVGITGFALLIISPKIKQ